MQSTVVSDVVEDPSEGAEPLDTDADPVERGERMLDESDEPDAQDAPAADADPAPLDASSQLPSSSILAESVVVMAREWDMLNRSTYEADPSGFVRVAAEAEQFSIALDGNGDGVFVAMLTDTAILGGSVNAQGQVVELVTLSNVNSDRDEAVALTSLRYPIIDPDRFPDIVHEFQEVAAGAPGDQITIVEGDSVVVVERLRGADGLVSIAYARGVDPAAFELRATQLAGAIVALRG